MSEWERAFPLLPEFVSVLLVGAVTTVKITAGGFTVAAVIGLVLGLLQTFPARLPRVLIQIYVEIFRGVPVLAQLFVLYFGLAQVGVKLDPIPVAILGFGLNGGAYLTEVFRSGLQAVPTAQTEAAFMIGMTRLGALRHVVLPQAMRVALPPLANYGVGLLKETSLASAVAAPELSFYARNLVTRTYLSGPIYALVALMYIVMSVPLSHFAHHLEMRFGRGRRV